MKEIKNGKVFPSEYTSILTINEEEDNASEYMLVEAEKLEGGEVKYRKVGAPAIKFLRQKDDGTWSTGILEEQLILMLMDRVEKKKSGLMGLKMDALAAYLEACKIEAKEYIFNYKEYEEIEEIKE